MLGFPLVSRSSLVLISCLGILSASASADSVASKCPDLDKCAHAVSALTGIKLVYDPGVLKGSIQATSNFELTKENAEVIFTQMLDQNGLTRVPLDEANTYTIMRQRDARDSALPRLDADSRTTPVIPKTWDLATLRYHLSNAELAEPIARNIRSFMPGNSRVIPDEISGRLILVVSYPVMANVLNLIQSMDVKASASTLKKLEDRRKEARESERRAAASRPAIENTSPGGR
jgi:hypothetical protein